MNKKSLCRKWKFVIFYQNFTMKEDLSSGVCDSIKLYVMLGATSSRDEIKLLLLRPVFKIWRLPQVKEVWSKNAVVQEKSSKVGKQQNKNKKVFSLCPMIDLKRKKKNHWASHPLFCSRHTFLSCWKASRGCWPILFLSVAASEAESIPL